MKYEVLTEEDGVERRSIGGDTHGDGGGRMN